jgi:hypothetical protein
MEEASPRPSSFQKLRFDIIFFGRTPSLERAYPRDVPSEQEPEGTPQKCVLLP